MSPLFFPKMIIFSSQPLYKNPIFLASSSSSFLQNVSINPNTDTKTFILIGQKRSHYVNKGRMLCRGLVPFVDPWAPTIDSQSLAPQLFAFSLFPYIGFLYFITKSKTAPKITLFGFYFLLAFVGATIPAGIYAKVHYGTSLSNVDWLHGGAESLLTLTNLFIVMGLRDALRKLSKKGKDDTSSVISSVKKEENSSV